MPMNQKLIVKSSIGSYLWTQCTLPWFTPPIKLHQRHNTPEKPDIPPQELAPTEHAMVSLVILIELADERKVAGLEHVNAWSFKRLYLSSLSLASFPWGFFGYLNRKNPAYIYFQFYDLAESLFPIIILWTRFWRLI
jgi:hypothetical protein